MISIQQSDCSSFCPTFSFMIEDAHFAAVFPSCSMLYGMLRSANDYSHRLCWWWLWSASYTKETKYMAIDRNTNTNIYIQNMTSNTNIDTNVSSGPAGGDSLPLLLRKPGRKALLWSSRLPGGELSPMIIIITRSYAAADLDWIVGPGYSPGG